MMGNAVYVAIGVGGLMKIGTTRNIEGRIKSLRAQFKARGSILARIDSIHCVWGNIAEKRLVDSIVAQGLSRAGREWFSGGDFDSMVQIAYRVAAEVNIVAMRPRRYKPNAFGQKEKT